MSSDPKVPHAQDFTRVVRENLSWYNSFQRAAPGILELPRDKFRRHRESRSTVHGYQEFYDDVFCLIHVRAENEEKVETISCTNNVVVKFSIRGGAEIPHFCLTLTLIGDAVSNRKEFLIIWTAFGDRGFNADRPINKPNETPRESFTYTFSSRLQGLTFTSTKLSSDAASGCQGKANSDNYTITWGHTEAPFHIGFDTPPAAIDGFTAVQRRSLEVFRRLLATNMRVRVTTRARGTLLQNWRFFAAMPKPTPGYYPLFDCRYVASGGWCRMENIPSLNDDAIRAHFAVRNRGWMNNPPSFRSPPLSGVFCIEPFLTFINERQYEVLKTVGLLREAEHQATTYCDKFNREYTIQLYPVSLIHGKQSTCIEQYFYAILNVTPVKLPSDAFSEHGLALPEPGTQVTITSTTHGKRTKETWSGVVISFADIPFAIAEDHQEIVVVRIKRSELAQSAGSVLKVSGFVKFGRDTPAFRQAKDAIRYAMYGNKDLGIPSDNRMKKLLLAHDNGVIKHEPTSQFGPVMSEQFNKLPSYLNGEQKAAIREGMLPSTSYKNYVSLVTGPPGTGKTIILIQIALHHRRLNNKTLIVCGSNHGLDVIARRLVNALQQENLSTDGVYRLDTVFDEDIESQMAPRVPEKTQNTQGLFQSTKEQLQKAGIEKSDFNLLRSSIEGSAHLSENVSLGRHILRRLELAVEKKSQWPQKTEHDKTEMFLLWQLLTYQRCLAQRGVLFFEAADTASVDIQAKTSSSLLDEDPVEILKRLNAQYKRAWLELQEFYVKSASIILCTASTAGRKALRGFEPKIVIVDEASQVAESVVLSPMIRFYRSVRKIILCGDVAQLPPTITSSGKNEAYAQERLSLFERFLITGVHHVSLKAQYRMHPDIAEFVSRGFYQGTLRNSYLKGETFRGLKDIMERRYGVARGNSYFISVTNSTLCRRKSGTSFFNPQYIVLIANFVKEFVEAGCPSDQIMVLSYYSEERNIMKRLIHDNLKFKQVQIMSIDAAQGHESRLVIVSTTRPGGKGGLGFVADANRMCVALSRAMDALLVIGHEKMADGPSMGRGFDLWRQLVAHYRDRNRLARATSTGKDLLKQHLGIPNPENFEEV